MQILELIDREVKKAHVEFLVIGGHALHIHGYPRQTGDVDLLVCRDDKAFWENLLERLDYERYQETEVFARHSPKKLAAWPIDLMYVEASVFQSMLTDSIEGDFGTLKAKVPSARHMVALKLHVLKQRQEHRELKELCVKYQRGVSLSSSQKSKSNHKEQSCFLDLPDDPTFVSLPPKLTLAQSIKLCEEMLPVWNKRRIAELKKLPLWDEPFYL